MVDEEKGVSFCHRCHWGGGKLDLICAIGLADNYIEALKVAADMQGLKIDGIDDPRMREARQRARQQAKLCGLWHNRLIFDARVRVEVLASKLRICEYLSRKQSEEFLAEEEAEALDSKTAEVQAKLIRQISEAKARVEVLMGYPPERVIELYKRVIAVRAPKVARWQEISSSLSENLGRQVPDQDMLKKQAEALTGAMEAEYQGIELMAARKLMAWMIEVVMCKQFIWAIGEIKVQKKGRKA